MFEIAGEVSTLGFRALASMGDDMEEALMAQREWLEKHRASAPSARLSVRSHQARLLALVALIAVPFARFRYTLLKWSFLWIGSAMSVPHVWFLSRGMHAWSTHAP